MTDPRTEDIKGHCPECEAGLAALRAAFDAANDRPEPIAQWEDPRVQAVYEVIAFCDTPPPEHHWEGWTARRIVDRLAALEQPEQEPVAWMYVGLTFNNDMHGPHLVWKPEHMDAMSAEKGVVASPLYTHPPRREWRGLTYQEIDDLQSGMQATFKDICAIEAALKEKNHE